VRVWDDGWVIRAARVIHSPPPVRDALEMELETMTRSEVKILFVAPALVMLLALKLPAAELASADRATPSEPEQLETWWVDLAKHEPDASRALLNLAAKPNAVVAFLKGKLRPLKIDAEAVKALLLKLGSDDESVWKAAFEQLEYFDPRLAISLETLMNDVTDSPARQRMVELLSGRPAGSLQGKQVRLVRTGEDAFNFIEGRVSWWAEHQVARLGELAWNNKKSKWTQAVRAIVLLQHIGTPDALAILKDIASGHPDAQPTKVAKEALAARKVSDPLLK
jgi:hypothetical protein